MGINKQTLKCEIFCLGNELLIGRTINKNATEIALTLSKLGFKVVRETTVRDDLENASIALLEILKRQPEVVIVTGGLGPTHDDIQVEIIAKSTTAVLGINEIAVEMIMNRYDISRDQLSASMIKMATLPKAATPIQNSEGTAPGFKLKYNNTWIFGLPGVPREMRAILKEGISPFLQNEFPLQKLVEFGFSVRGVGESKIVTITENIIKQYPDIGFKSHPKKDKNGYWLDLHTYAIGIEEDQVRTATEKWYSEISKYFEVKLSSIKPIFDDRFIAE